MSGRRIFYISNLILLSSLSIFLYLNIQKLSIIVFPMLIGGFISYAILPGVKFFQKKSMTRQNSIISVYVILITVFSITAFLLIPVITKNILDFISSMPQALHELKYHVGWIRKILVSDKLPKEIKNILSIELENATFKLQKIILVVFKNNLLSTIKLIPAIFETMIGMVIAFYLIRDAEIFKSVFVSMFPSIIRKDIIVVGREINLVLKRFITGQIITAIIVGTMEAVGLYFLGVKYFLFLGFFAGIANIIPYFGPIIGAIPAIAVALIDSPMKAVWTVVFFIIIQQIDNIFITPKMVEGGVGLHPLTTIISVLIGGEFYGIIGMFIAVPVFAIIKILIKRTYERIA